MPHHRDTRIVRRSDGSLSIFTSEHGIDPGHALAICGEIQEAARAAYQRREEIAKRDRELVEARLAAQTEMRVAS